MSDITLPGAGAAGRKLLFISDLHPQFRKAELARFPELVKLIHAESPDYLLLGGDGVGDTVYLPRLPQMWKQLSDGAAHSFALPGNWEQGKYWLGTEFFQELYARGGFRYLSNESWSDGKLFLAGLANISFPEVAPRLPEQPPPETTFNLVGIHRPDALFWAENYEQLKNYSLVLSGHLHGGQVRLFGKPLVSIGIYGRKIDYGLYRCLDGDTRLYISSGLGEGTIPWRVNCPREVVIVHLH